MPRWYLPQTRNLAKDEKPFRNDCCVFPFTQIMVYSTRQNRHSKDNHNNNIISWNELIRIQVLDPNQGPPRRRPPVPVLVPVPLVFSCFLSSSAAQNVAIEREPGSTRHV